MTIQPIHWSVELKAMGILIDSAVTRRTAHPFVYMNAVIEISVVRQVVHSNPLDRFAVAEAGTHRLQIRAICPKLFMAVHAGVC